ncbi:PRC-barrel domain containing protein [uncultured Olsenella sp.]|uniref:PRC-barrel domain-containing protein n=1 Tax=uncultured Olsenella sp. TaxID=190764 RepID=UPI0026DA7E6E|nr:PRC-barrel domain containing protein [uncultured Olsenella sp.]
MARISELMGRKVYELRPARKAGGEPRRRRVGRVHAAVFSPDGRSLVGYMVRRPDIAGMVRRPDAFLALDSLRSGEDAIFLTKNAGLALDDGARGRLGLEWDSCVMWAGMDAKTERGRVLGYVGDATYDAGTGRVQSFAVGDGGVAQSLVGSVQVPASMLRGYRGGYMVVDDAASRLSLSGGAAAKAGEASARAQIAGRKVAARADETASQALDRGSSALGRAIGKARRSVEGAAQGGLEPKKATATQPGAKKTSRKNTGADGARAVGRQMKKAGGMFGSFMDEYRKASK